MVLKQKGNNIRLYRLKQVRDCNGLNIGKKIANKTMFSLDYQH